LNPGDVVYYNNTTYYQYTGAAQQSSVDLSTGTQNYETSPSTWLDLATTVTSGVGRYDHVDTETPTEIATGDRVKLDTTGEIYERTGSPLQATLVLSESEQVYTDYANNDWELAPVDDQDDGDQDYDSDNTTLTSLAVGEIVRDSGVNYEWAGSGPLVAVLDLSDGEQGYATPANGWTLELPTTTTDGVRVSASDSASIDAASKVVSASSTSNDGGASILNGL
ncbi:MAG: hypothetical protein GY708_10865, partial [Actinomycetia bacterium]|nr:hypothetical protein [Actinomycetes bacterium]